MKKLTFRECRKYIEALKKSAIVLGVKGHEVKNYLVQDLKDKVVIATSKKHRLVAIASEEGIAGFHFDENAFEKEEQVTSWEPYEQEFYNFSIFQLDAKQLALFLKADDKVLVTVHEEIDFELGLRLRKTFLATTEVASVIYYWQSGQLLICKRNEEGKDVFSLSDARTNITQDEALQIIRNQYKNVPCVMKVLRTGPSEKPLPSPMVEEKQEEDMMVVDFAVLDKEAPAIIPASPDEDDDIIAQKLNEAITPVETSQESEGNATPEPIPENKQRLKLLEESVVIHEHELPELGPGDMDIFKKYGIVPPPEDKQQKQRFVLQEKTEIPLDESIPSLNDQELDILKKYGVNLSETEQTTCRQIREAFEDSVLLTDEELPPVGNEDINILKKYGIVLEEKKPEQPSIINSEELAVLRKYGIKLTHGEKSTAKEIQEAYKLAVALKRIPDNIAAKDRAVFNKFGFVIATKPFYQTVKVAYVAVPVLVILMICLGSFAGSYYRANKQRQTQIAICKQSLDQVEQYKNDLAKWIDVIKQTQNTLSNNYPPKQGYPEPSIDIVEKLKEMEGVSSKLNKMLEKWKEDVNTGILEDVSKSLSQENIEKELKQDYLVSLKNIYEKVQTTLKSAQKLRQDRIDFCNRQLERVKQYTDQMIEETKSIRKVVSTMSSTYPPQQGYPEPSPKILSELEVLELKMAQLLDIQQEGKDYLQNEDFEKAIPYLSEERLDKEIKPSYLADLKRLTSRIQNTLNMAQFMESQKLQKMDVRKACRTLREHIIGYSQKLRILDENWKVLVEKYPAEKEFPPPPSGGQKLIADTSSQVKSLQQALAEIETHLYQDNTARALELCQPYLKLGTPDFTSLEAMNGSVMDALALCQKIASDKTNQRRILDLLLSLGKTVENFQQELDSIQESIKNLDSFPADLSVPRPDIEYKQFLVTSDTELKDLRSGIAQGRTLLDSAQFQQAIVLLEALAAKPDSISKLQQIRGNVQDAVLIARSMQKRSVMGKEISDLMKKAKDGLYQLQGVSSILEENVKTITEKYPASQGFPTSGGDYNQALQKSRDFKKKLQKMLGKVEGFLSKKALDSALDQLKRGSDDIQGAVAIIPSIQTANGELIKTIAKCEELDKQRKEIAQINTSRDKLKEYFKELEDQVQSIRTSVKRMKEEFPSQEGYKELPPEVVPALEKGSGAMENIQSVLSQGEKMIQEKKLSEALDHFDLAKISKLMDRNMITDMSKQRYKAEDILFEAVATSKRKSQVAQIKKVLDELQQRQENLKKVVEPLSIAIDIFKKDFSDKMFLSQDSYAEQACNEGKYEIKELERIIGEGEEYLHSGKYEDAINLINPYSHEVNPGVSKLNFVQNTYNRVQKLMEENRRMIQDRGFREEVERKLNAGREREERRKKWQRSPGAWYDQLSPHLASYAKMENQIANSLKDQGAIFAFYKIKSSMAELKLIPTQIADLEEMIYNIEQKGGNWEKIVADKQKDTLSLSQERQIKSLEVYIKTRKINLDVQQHLQNLGNVLAKLKKEMEQGTSENIWVSKDILKEVQKGLRPIEDEYRETYQPLNSILLNLENAYKK